MAKDPYKYFRVEARELLDGLSQGILQLEKGASNPEAVSRLLRFAHTLKGAARVVKQPAIAGIAHTAEGLLAPHRDAGRPLSKEEASHLLRLLDEIGVLLAALEPAGPSSTEATTPEPPLLDEALETLRVEIREMDSLLRGVTEAGVQLGAVREGLGGVARLRDLASLLVDLLAARPGEIGSPSPFLRRARSVAEELRSAVDPFERDLESAVDRADGELAAIRDATHRLRLLPAETVFASLDRSVRDAAQTLGKRVTFTASGGEVRLDANVLASLRDALMHVVRNAVAHGIETEADRVALGKPPAGRVRLQVERHGGRVAFVCSDDGRGIDLEAVRRAVLAKGLLPAGDAKSLPAEEILTLLRGGGITTSSDVTELSGRGIGLDVVRATAFRLKGEMSLRSEAGHGATVEIQVPISLASLQALLVESEGARLAIPLDAVRQTLRVRDSDIARSADCESLLHEGQVLPFLPLSRALGRSGAGVRKRQAWSTVVVHAGDRRMAVGVDRLHGTSSIVMRALPPVVDADPVISGASLDAEGNPQLVLDPAGLVRAADHFRSAISEEASPERAPILVIDDSLTTRMLEQSILQSAGYRVELAVSAEEGLDKARARRYSLFLVDVEMPGMNGFEFVALTRSDAGLRETPAILVTSRNAPEDLRRGEEAGARAYIVKSDFDQARLLETIRGLIG